ncbi:MAG: AcrR family transcriptional regulator [Myxococcota bacterium]
MVDGLEWTMAKKNPTKGRKKRLQIREAAYACFSEDGYSHTSVDGICKHAGISKGSFYWHYPSKQDVFVDIIDVWTRQVMDELYEQFEDAVLEDDFRPAVTAAIQREMKRGRQMVPLWVEFSVLGRHEPEIQQALAKFYRRARSALTEIFRPALQDLCTDAEIRGAASMAFGAYLGVMLQELSDSDRVDATEEVFQFMVAFAKVIGQSQKPH